MSNRAEMMRTLADMGRKHPEMRFGQLVSMLSHLARGMARSATYDVEDEELLAAALSHIANCPKCRDDEPAAATGEVGSLERAATLRNSS
jgi:hypothetical protein